VGFKKVRFTTSEEVGGTRGRNVGPGGDGASTPGFERGRGEGDLNSPNEEGREKAGIHDAVGTWFCTGGGERGDRPGRALTAIHDQKKSIEEDNQALCYFGQTNLGEEMEKTTCELPPS